MGIALEASQAQSIARRLEQVLVITLAGGILAFGAVYPWGYWPLAIGSQIVGFGGLFLERRFRAGASRALTVSLLMLMAAGSLQLVPLPLEWTYAISPAAAPILSGLSPAVAAQLTAVHPLSIQPSQSVLGLAMLGSFCVLAIGTSRLFALTGARHAVSSLTIVGGIIALVGLVQNATYNGKLYGFWVSQDGGSPFGPFVNRNHFAGCMLLILPLTLGAVAQRIGSSGYTGGRGMRDRLLWLASAHASKLLLLCGAAAVMSLATVVAMSRSGIGALGVTLGLIALFALRTGSPRTRWATLAFVGVLAAAVTAYVGIDAIAERFSSGEGSALAGRWGPWSDAINVAGSFPIAGTGLNTYGAAMLFLQRHVPTVHFSAAHNDYLQLLAEGGLLLALPAVACIGFFIRDVIRRFKEDRGTSTYWLRAGAVTAIVALGLQELVDFSLQIPANAALFAVVCGIALHKAPRRRSPLVA